ncbi:MAG: potassium channel family protein [Promethearchaeota archaeon]
MIASIGFALIEKRSLLDSLYWAIVTLTTVGYGDITPVTFAGQIFAVLYLGEDYYERPKRVLIDLKKKRQSVIPNA